MSLHVNIIAPDRNVWDSNAEEVILPSSTAEVENDELTILVNGAEEGSKINKEEAQKNLEIMTARFNEAETSKEKIEATQNLRKARARVQASTM